MSTIVDTVNQGRAIIDNREAEALETLGRYWLEVEWRLQADIDALAAEIERRVFAGEVVDQQLLWTMQSYRRLQVEIERELYWYGQRTISVVNAAAKDAAMLGAVYADSVLSMEYTEAGLHPPLWERANREAVEAAYSISREGSPVEEIMRNKYNLTQGQFGEALINGIARGQGVVKLAETMRDSLSMGYESAILIAQTEMARAYRTGTINQYRKSGVVEYYVRLVQKEQACLACLMLDGEKYKLEDDMQDHPRGHCDTIAKVEGVPLPDWEKGPEWLYRQPEAVQRRIIGDTRFEIWNSGDLRLKDMIGKVHSDVWGDQPAILSFKKLREIHPRTMAAAEKAVAEGRARTRAKLRPPKPVKPKPIKPVGSGTMRQYTEKDLGHPLFDKASHNAVRNNQAAYNEYLASCRREGVTPLTQAEISARLQAELAKRDVVRRIETDDLERVLTAGRFKSQFEVSKSGGTYNPSLRQYAEREGLGVPYDIDPKLRPIYGYAKDWNDPYDSATQYGDAVVRFKRNAVAGRTTWTYDDSLGGFNSGKQMGTPILEPGIESFHNNSWSTDGELFNFLHRNDQPMYWEVQIHGGVTVGDIEEVIFTQYDPGEGIKRMLNENGIPWKMGIIH